MGWQRADWWNRSYLAWFVLAAVSMMAGSVVMVLLGLRHPLASQMSFLQVVLSVWLLSSVSEEVYVPAWFNRGSPAVTTRMVSTRHSNPRSCRRLSCSPRCTDP